MLRTIIVPLDGSVLAERAVSYASALARGFGARLVLLRVASPLDDQAGPAHDRDILSYLEGAAIRTRANVASAIAHSPAQ